MELPQEIETWYTLPAVRRELARILVSRGLTQRDVAKKLGVTEAAVSQYLANKRAVSVEYPVEVRKILETAASEILAATDLKAVRTAVQRVSDSMKEHKVICAIHKKQGKGVDEDCSTCFE